MFFGKVRVSRASLATRTDAAAVANATLVAAPATPTDRIVVDYIVFSATATAAGVFELKNDTGAYSGSTGVIGLALPIGTSQLSGVAHLDLPEGLPLIYNTTGTINPSYISVVYHLEHGG